MIDPAQIPNSASSQAASTAARAFAGIAWLVYVGYLLLSDLPPGNSLLHTQPETLQTAIDLSLNFWFVLPIVAPNIAPVLHPALEGLFNIVVAWGLLFWGFLIDGRHQKLPIQPFLLGTALLTNVFYLLWLALRAPNPQPPTGTLTRLEQLAESRWLPMTLSMVVLASVGWAAVARPEFGDLSTRWQSLIHLIQTDRLIYSFWVDLLVFWCFQSWLVSDDMARRQGHNVVLRWVAQIVPFFGLVVYLLRRPPIGKTEG
jgi:hypothetical protein